jgi:adenylate kinase family enzyme
MTPQAQFRLFIIGLPGVGKTTVSRFLYEYLRRNLAGVKVQRFDDYGLLIAKARNPNEPRVSTNERGQFTINENDRDQVLTEVLESLGSQASPSKAQVCLLEFSRRNYVKSLEVLQVKANYAIIYLRTDDLTVRMERNRSRDPDQQVRTIPDEVMKLPSCSTDDLVELRSRHAGRLFEIDSSQLTLAAMREEVCLRAREILQSRFTFGEAIPFWQELFLVVTVLIQCGLGLAVLFSVWALPNLAAAKSLRNLLTYPSLRTLAYVACAGALGAITYSIRCIGRYSILRMLDFEAYKWWYLLRPLQGALLAVGIYAILSGGIASMGGRFDGSGEGRKYALFGLSFLIGISTEAFVEWLVAVAKKLTNYRVQPPEYQGPAESSTKTGERGA